ncbi:MAG: GNAT family N-acetyltransferase [Bacillota bacterium]|jgi:GNAT superfamily N-acetyltransferase
MYINYDEYELLELFENVSNIIHDAGLALGFIAISDDKPAGIILYEMKKSECEIILLESFVEKIGIGTTLLKCVEEKAIANGRDRIWLITTNDNIKAIRFLPVERVFISCPT